MACGKPIISSELRPMKRLLDETGAGIYGKCSSPIEIANLIDRMMKMDFQKMSEQGYNAFQNIYHWEHEEEQLELALRFVSKK
jgi:glycosyltransferase involved in cell wall biosynthesis